MEDVDDINFISPSWLFREDSLHEDVEDLQDTEDDAQVESCHESDGAHMESVPGLNTCSDVRKKSIVKLRSAMRNKLFKMSSKEVALYLTDISLG